jgi:hypothetical protein
LARTSIANVLLSAALRLIAGAVIWIALLVLGLVGAGLGSPDKDGVIKLWLIATVLVPVWVLWPVVKLLIERTRGGVHQTTTSFTPSYDWRCYACSTHNQAGTPACSACGARSTASAAEIEAAAQAKQSASPPVSNHPRQSGDA